MARARLGADIAAQAQRHLGLHAQQRPSLTRWIDGRRVQGRMVEWARSGGAAGLPVPHQRTFGPAKCRGHVILNRVGLGLAVDRGDPFSGTQRLPAQAGLDEGRDQCLGRPRTSVRM
ncbi:MAG TPA: hypothetical protein VIK56_04350 [Rhodoferax sp.]